MLNIPITYASLQKCICKTSHMLAYTDAFSCSMTDPLEVQQTALSSLQRRLLYIVLEGGVMYK